MELKKYPSIKNTYNERVINTIRKHKYDIKEWWSVEEKIHGANLSFHINMNTGDVRWASRNRFLEPDDTFNNYQEIADRYADAIEDLKSRVEVDCKVLSVYGEIFGGVYPHDDVEQNSDASRVQKGVFYSPNIEYMLFDVAVDGLFWPWVRMDTVLEDCGFLTVPHLAYGTFDECLEHPNCFPTLVPDILGLPEIEDNYCEGVVIRRHNRYGGDLNMRHFDDRILLKNKNDKFKEKQQKAKVDKPSAGDKVVNKWTDLIKEYCVWNRFTAVASKIANLEEAHPEEVLGRFVHDAMNDAFDEHDNESLNSNDIRSIRNNLRSGLRQQVRQWTEEFLDK